MIVQSRQRNNTIHASKFNVQKDIKKMREQMEMENELKALEKRKLSQRREEEYLKYLDFMNDFNASFTGLSPDDLKGFDPYKELELKEKVTIFLNSNNYIILFTIIVFFTLFLNDFKYIFFNHQADVVFNVIFIIFFIIFLIDILLSNWTIEDYMFGFYFWLDSIATTCMLFETDWVITPTVNRLTIFSSETYDYSKYSLEKSSRSSRVIITISVLRIIRLIRIVKLYKNFRIWENNNERESKLKEIRERKIEAIKRLQQGKNIATIGKLSKNLNIMLINYIILQLKMIRRIVILIQILTKHILTQTLTPLKTIAS